MQEILTFAVADIWFRNTTLSDLLRLPAAPFHPAGLRGVPARNIAESSMVDERFLIWEVFLWAARATTSGFALSACRALFLLEPLCASSKPSARVCEALASLRIDSAVNCKRAEIECSLCARSHAVALTSRRTPKLVVSGGSVEAPLHCAVNRCGLHDACAAGLRPHL